MLAGNIGALVALILVNAFFVAAEFALVSTRFEQTGNDLATRVLRRQLEQLDQYLASCQLGVTIASLALGALGEPTIAKLLEPALGRLPYAHAAATTIVALLVMTVLHITVGEQAPKSFAIGSSGRVARLCALPLELFTRLLRPLVIGLNAAANALVRALGGTPASSHAQQASLEELRQIIHGVARSGEIDHTDAKMLHGIFTLDERRAEDILTPRSRLTAVRSGQTVREALACTRGSGHDRFPLLDQDGQQLLGIVSGRTLADALYDDEGEKPVDSYAREMLIVPPTIVLDQLLAKMRAAHASACAVVDEYGSLAGIVTIEDILEEVVGDIYDEDDPPAPVAVHPNGAIRCSGDVSLSDIAEHGPALGERGTLNGIIQHTLGRLARTGDHLELNGWQVQVVRATRGQAIECLLWRDGGE